jgi:hypothetical protein
MEGITARVRLSLQHRRVRLGVGEQVGCHESVWSRSNDPTVCHVPRVGPCSRRAASSGPPSVHPGTAGVPQCCTSIGYGQPRHLHSPSPCVLSFGAVVGRVRHSWALIRKSRAPNSR